MIRRLGKIHGRRLGDIVFQFLTQTGRIICKDLSIDACA
jgi:hypothetical protein